MLAEDGPRDLLLLLHTWPGSCVKARPRARGDRALGLWMSLSVAPQVARPAEHRSRTAGGR